MVEERIPKEVFMDSRKTKNRMGGRPEECITDPRNKKTEEKSWG
jgi:hypothetical protein